MDEEFAFHVDMRVRELIARGMAPDEARAEALRGFGDVGRVKVRLRRLGRRRDEATRRRQWWEDARQDLVFALRQLRRAPLFALMAILALALGIGANTAVFSVVDAVLLKPLPFANPGRLVFVGMESPQGRFVGMFPAGFEFLRGDAATLLDVAAFQVGMSTTYTGGDVPVPVRSRQVSASFFRLFGLHTILGRSFTPQEDAPHAGRFVVLTKGMWQERFHADPSIVGKSISLGGDPYTVVGVLDRFSFDDLGGTPDVFVPLQRDPNTRDQGYRILVGARMKPGVTLTQASAAVARSTRAFTTRFPNALPAEGRFAVMPMMDDLAPHARKELYVLLGAVAFVLLVACANVANLLLARARSRTREIAIRAALGGSPGRIVRQILTESVLLALAGGALGFLFGVVGIRSLLAVSPAGLPRLGARGAHVTMDWRVLAFTVGVSLLTAILLGLAPSRRAARTDVVAALNDGSAGAGSGMRHHRTRSALVIAESALALVLLVGSALMIRTVIALSDVDPGFDAHHVLVLRTYLTGQRFANTAAVAQTVREGVRQLERVRGVEKASAACFAPLEGLYSLGFTIVGRPATEGRDRPWALWQNVSPGYFDVFDIKLLRGRTFNESDDAHGTSVVIINDALARKYWPNGGALGAEITIGHGVSKSWDTEPERRVVGVVSDARNLGINRDPLPQLYEPQAQTPDAVSRQVSRQYPLAWVVRTRTPQPGLRKSILTALRQATGVPVSSISAMDQVLHLSTSRWRFGMWLMTIFGAGALLLAATGVYALMAYTVVQRAPEIAIRLALGAERANVRNMVVWQGMRLVLGGVAVGILAALGLSRLIAVFLYGVQAWDPLVFVSVPLVLGAVALLAVWWPARRASRVDPLVAIRSE